MERVKLKDEDFNRIISSVGEFCKKHNLDLAQMSIKEILQIGAVAAISDMNTANGEYLASTVFENFPVISIPLEKGKSAFYRDEKGNRVPLDPSRLEYIDIHAYSCENSSCANFNKPAWCTEYDTLSRRVLCNFCASKEGSGDIKKCSEKRPECIKRGCPYATVPVKQLPPPATQSQPTLFDNWNRR